jgi:hypothetical protein
MEAPGRACSVSPKTAIPLLVAAFLVSSPVAVATVAAKGNDVWLRASQSWALGVVVPNGAGLAEGSQLSWTDARNITALARLPNITEPDGVTYLVLSAEGDDKAVFQVAAGVWPGSSKWSAYSWYITGIGTSSLSYRWVMNSSTPSMSPGDLVSISITVTGGAWGMRVQDISTGEGKTGSVPSPSLTKFTSGDQEVVALESYTRSASTFRDMGNATLAAVLVDGRRIMAGWYAYGGWDPMHNPLFGVGSSDPPTYLSLIMGKDGGAVWSYDAQWTGAVWNTSVHPVALAYAALAALVPIAFVLGSRFGRVGREEG